MPTKKKQHIDLLEIAIDSVKKKTNIIAVEETNNDIIVLSGQICSYEDFLKWLDMGWDNFHNKAQKLTKETIYEENGYTIAKLWPYYQYEFSNILIRIYWFDHETGGLWPKHLAYLVYNFLLDIPVYTAEIWRPGGKRSELFEIWWKDNSKQGVIVNEYAVNEFCHREDMNMEYLLRQSIKSSMGCQWDEPIDGNDFEIVHRVQFMNINKKLIKLQEAFAQIVAHSPHTNTLTVISNSLANIMEYSIRGETDTTTIEIIQKDKDISKLTDENKQNLADFLDVFTNTLLFPI
jgi:hypothetical protein